MSGRFRSSGDYSCHIVRTNLRAKVRTLTAPQRVVGAGASALGAYATQATRCPDAVTCRWLAGCPPVAVHLCPVWLSTMSDGRCPMGVHGSCSRPRVDIQDSPMAVQIVWLPRWPAMAVLANQRINGCPKRIVHRNPMAVLANQWLSQANRDGPRMGVHAHNRASAMAVPRPGSQNRAIRSAMAVLPRIHGWLS